MLHSELSLQRHGQGLFTYSDGTFFEGSGASSFSSNLNHKGGWCNDVKEGVGRLTFPNGDSLTGFWKNDNVVNATYTKGSVDQCSRLVLLSLLFKQNVNLTTHQQINKTIAHADPGRRTGRQEFVNHASE